MDDAFEIDSVLITPDVLRNAVVQADQLIDDFRIMQTGPHEVSLTLPIQCSDDAKARAFKALAAILQTR